MVNLVNTYALIISVPTLTWIKYYIVKYRTSTGVFELNYADNVIFAIVKGGPTKASADGLYIITEPLQRGNHTINFKSSLIC